jgi:glycosyltransferase involved in cell wall biosynthesis
MNNAISRASGEFIAILNSDDFALPGRLERQVAFLDTNHKIAGVFGLPKFVDENGRPTRGFFDFTLPLSLPDLSRKSLLRHFFYSGNLLCAPTAMIRRSAYQKIGSYDPRLTNLQDFDMWVRLCTDHDISVMREELTAFRILANARNMSAPRRDSILRSQFEATQILRRFRSMNPEFLLEIFHSDLIARKISTEGSHNRWLAELALAKNTPVHRLFAVQTLYETAETDADFRRLRDVTGEVDLFGTLATFRQSRRS